MDVAVTRRDLHGNDWEVTTLARQNRSMAEIITAEWGLNEHKVVHKTNYNYVYCKCDKQPRCGMVVKYTLSEEDVRRENKNGHALNRNIRETIREVAAMPSNPAAALVAWSQKNPDAADADFPARGQVSRRNPLKFEPAFFRKPDL